MLYVSDEVVPVTGYYNLLDSSGDACCRLFVEAGGVFPPGIDYNSRFSFDEGYSNNNS